VSLYQTVYENIKAQDYLHNDAEVETEAVRKSIDEFITIKQENNEGGR
jgi:hypothetical protein